MTMVSEKLRNSATGDTTESLVTGKGSDKVPPEEYFDVLDENGEKTGRTKLRREVHRDGDWHRTVNIFVVKGDEVLLQKRCAAKDSYPGMWDISCGGHIAASEESRERRCGSLGKSWG